MNRFLAVFSVVTATSLGIAAWAGGQEGHGGIAVVCPQSVNPVGPPSGPFGATISPLDITQPQTIGSMNLLDLWEPDDLIFERTGKVSRDAQIDAALGKLDFAPKVKYLFQTEVARIKKLLSGTNKVMKLTDDAFSIYEVDPCRYFQLARMGYNQEKGKVVVKVFNPIYNSPLFSNTDRAALILHEAVYSLERTYHRAEDSRVSRRVVSHLIAKQPLTGDEQSFIEKTFSPTQVHSDVARGDVKLGFDIVDTVPTRMNFEMEVKAQYMGNGLNGPSDYRRSAWSAVTSSDQTAPDTAFATLQALKGFEWPQPPKVNPNTGVFSGPMLAPLSIQHVRFDFGKDVLKAGPQVIHWKLPTTDLMDLDVVVSLKMNGKLVSQVRPSHRVNEEDGQGKSLLQADFYLK